MDRSRISYSPINDDVIVLHLKTDKYNSLRIPDIKSVIEVVENAEQDNQIKMLIITGSGNSFCTGLDVEHLKINGICEVKETLYYLELLVYKIITSPILIVTAINGHAIGGGAVIAVASDYRIALEDQKIKIGFPEYKKGLFLTKIMRSVISERTYVYPRLILFGDYIGVGEAIRLGIIDESSQNDLIDQLVKRFSSLDNQAARIYKQNYKAAISAFIPYMASAEYEELGNRIIGLGNH